VSPHPAYPIETARLTLRPLRPDDLDDFHAYDSRPDVARYLYGEPRDRHGSRQALDEHTRKTAFAREGDRIVLGAVWRDAGRLVGHVSLAWLSREHRQGEVGFVFNPEFQGRGLATEAAVAMLRLGFEDAHLHRIIGRCDRRNHASVRLMERLGMRREAHFVECELFKGDWGDVLVYAVLATEWDG